MPTLVPDPLRVALLTHRFPVVSETFVIRLAADLAGAGCDLRVLAADCDAGPDEPAHELVREAGLEARTARASVEGRLGLGRALALAGGRRSAAPLLLAAADRAAPRRALAVARLMAAQPPLDVVHAQFATLGLTAMRHRRYGTLRTRALVVHLRGYDITRHVEEHGRSVYDGLFRRADLFLANSAHMRERALALGCPPGKALVIGSPIDTDRFRPPATREPPEGRPARLVAVGRLVEKKGFADAIDAVARLRAEGREVSLDILGDGPLRAELERRAGEGVRLLGAASSATVLAALHRADIALAPSVTAADGDQDGPVNTLKEAMATGLPVVATRHGGIPELVEHAVSGLLVPERDPQALARAIAQLIDAPGDWPRLGAAGRRRVVQSYDRRQYPGAPRSTPTDGRSRGRRHAMNDETRDGRRDPTRALRHDRGIARQPLPSTPLART